MGYRLPAPSGTVTNPEAPLKPLIRRLSSVVRRLLALRLAGNSREPNIAMNVLVNGAEEGHS
jgi:hypothetical protein